MSGQSTQEQYLSSIADAIRAKEGSSSTIPANTFASRITAIKSATDFGVNINIEVDIPGITLTATNGDTVITEISDSSGMCVFHINSSGTWDITGVYNGITRSCSIYVEEDYNVQLRLIPPAKTLNDYTWEEISENSFNASSIWDIGDTKTILINGTVGTLNIYENLNVYIIGFHHNASVEGYGISFGGFKTTSGVDIALCDSHLNSTSTDGSKWFNMNHWGNYNYGGWAGCDMRYDILGSTNVAPSGYGSAKTTSTVGYNATSTTATRPVANTLMAALPSDLRAVMKPITKWTDAVGNKSNVNANVKAFVDYLPLLAEYESFGVRSYANQYEQNHQAQYAYYASGNSKIKYNHSSTASSVSWWGRSAGYYANDGFCSMSSGAASRAYVRYSRALAPAFLI